MLFQIIYQSKAKENIQESELKDILNTAVTFNAKANITGCLLFHKGYFLQLLEGEFEIINNLYNKIKKDPRHSDVVTLHMQETIKRVYDDWSMAFKELIGPMSVMEEIGAKSFSELPTQNQESLAAKEIFNIMSEQVLDA